MELAPNEKLLIEEIRKHGPYAEFKVVKRPTSVNKEGEIVSVTAFQTMRIEFGTQLKKNMV